MSAPAHPDSTDLDRLHSAVKREKADQAPESAPAPMWAMFLLMLVAIIAGGQLGPNEHRRLELQYQQSLSRASTGGDDRVPAAVVLGDALDPFALP
jgi:hypothetical protein